MNGLTKNVGKSYLKKASKTSSDIEIRNILICRPNSRLGNLLLTTPIIQELSDTFPDSKIDIIVKGGLANVLYENYPNINSIMCLPKKPFKELFKYIKTFFSVRNKRYDLVINPVRDSSSGRILTLLTKSKFKVFGLLEDEIEDKAPDHSHMAKNAVYCLRYYLSKIGLETNNKPIPVLDLKLSETELQNGMQLINQLVDPEKETISIFTYATGAKCYPVDWWLEFYDALKKEYQPKYNILEVLPVENISQINFTAPSFYSKDVREIGAVFANSKVFIGADSGIMHLSSAAKAKTIGLFSVTNEAVYKPYGNNSYALNTNNKTPTECVNELIGTL